MRIALWATQNLNKKYFTDSFIQKWPNYKLITNITSPVEKLDKEQSEVLLNDSIDNCMKYTKKDNILYNDCTLDILSHIMLLGAKEQANVDAGFVQKAITLSKQSMHFYDIIFYFPEFKIRLKNESDTAMSDYEDEVNNFMGAIHQTYLDQKEIIFPFKDINGTPAIIELQGSSDEMLQLVNLYINPQGAAYEKEDSLISEYLQ